MDLFKKFYPSLEKFNGIKLTKLEPKITQKKERIESVFAE